MHDGTNPMADGMAFVLQGDSPQALGFQGGGLGYGSDTPGGPQGIPNSIAIKFDLYSNAGEGTDSTGLFVNGDSPTVPSGPGDVLVDLSSTGIDLHSQDVFQVTLAYDGTTLTETITDTVTHASFTTSYTVNLATLIGGDVGYAGFTGGTGGLTTVADVQTWTYQFKSPTGQAQLAAGGPAPGTAGPALTADELAPVVQEALANWAAAGLTSAQVAQLRAVQYQIGRLGGSLLGLTDLGGNVVALDATAAGYGWSVGGAGGRMDLLTVVEHELGHVLGLSDLDSPPAANDLMTTTLAAGVHRSPAPTDGTIGSVAVTAPALTVRPSITAMGWTTAVDGTLLAPAQPFSTVPNSAAYPVASARPADRDAVDVAMPLAAPPERSAPVIAMGPLSPDADDALDALFMELGGQEGNPDGAWTAPAGEEE
jgi:hypothetical protein